MSGTDPHPHPTGEPPMRTAVILPWQADGQARSAAAGWPGRSSSPAPSGSTSCIPRRCRCGRRSRHCKVIDRTGLILDIFGERARTREGALQAELAHLHYQRSRLVRSWTHLGRQRGGFGFLGGPGETQIEADRRLIGEMEVLNKADLLRL